MDAVEIAAIADQDGAVGVQRALGCSARQAELVTVAAKRALRQGRDLDPNEIPVGSVSVSQARQQPVPTPAPVQVDEAEARARQIRQLPPSDRGSGMG